MWAGSTSVIVLNRQRCPLTPLARCSAHIHGCPSLVWKPRCHHIVRFSLTCPSLPSLYPLYSWQQRYSCRKCCYNLPKTNPHVLLIPCHGDGANTGCNWHTGEGRQAAAADIQHHDRLDSSSSGSTGLMCNRCSSLLIVWMMFSAVWPHGGDWCGLQHVGQRQHPCLIIPVIVPWMWQCSWGLHSSSGYQRTSAPPSGQSQHCRNIVGLCKDAKSLFIEIYKSIFRLFLSWNPLYNLCLWGNHIEEKSMHLQANLQTGGVRTNTAECNSRQSVWSHQD